MATNFDLTLECFREAHPGINLKMLVEYASVSLAEVHASPAEFDFYHGDDEPRSAEVRFRSPDPRSALTLEREDVVEKGAIVMAGLCLTQFEGKQITRVVKRGTKIDYFVGESPQDIRWILEVGGTDKRLGLAALRALKRKQLEQSPYRRSPHHKNGFVAATRFAPRAASALDPISSE